MKTNKCLLVACLMILVVGCNDDETVNDPVPNVTNPITGRIWMDRNLGASQVATSSTDKASYGRLYQWGRGTDGHQSRTSRTTGFLSDSDVPGNADFIYIFEPPTFDWRKPQNDNLWQGLNGINNPCPEGYRLPTEVEWLEERASWSSQNAEGAFNSPLKLPMAGSRDYVSTHLENVDSKGGYWSSTVESFYSHHLNFSNSNSDVYSFPRAEGFSVRCIQD